MIQDWTFWLTMVLLTPAIVIALLGGYVVTLGVLAYYYQRKEDRR